MATSFSERNANSQIGGKSPFDQTASNFNGGVRGDFDQPFAMIVSGGIARTIPIKFE